MKAPSKPCETPEIQAPRPPGAPEGRSGGGLRRRRGVGKRRACALRAAPCPLASLGAGLRSAAPQPQGHRTRSGLLRRSRDAPRRSQAAPRRGRRPLPRPSSPAPPRGDPAKLGPIASASPAALAWGARHAQASEDRRGQAAAPSATARPAPVGADAAPPRPTPARHRTRSAVLTEASGTARRTQSRKARRLRPGLRRKAPCPAPVPRRLSGRLAALAETAKAYARSAQADNTQRAYAGDWRQFASWLRRQGLAETPPDPEAVGLYLASQVERRGPSFRSRPSSGASPGSPGDTDNSASRSRSATAISQRCLPASAAATPALPSRRPRSSPMSFWPCWRRWRWT